MQFALHQDNAKKKTRFLVSVFCFALVAIVTVIYFSVVFGGWYFQSGRFELVLFQPETLAITVLVVGVVVVFGALFKQRSLSGGGRSVAESLGGELLVRGNLGYKEQRLLNVVEEMAIASGTPVPQVYLLRDRAINAFAAGYTPEQAVVGITTGAVNELNREELQGVIAHEFSHILNGDMRLNIRLIAVVFGISCLAALGRILIRSGGRRRKGKGNSLPVLGVVLLIVGYIGTVAGHLIRASVSRQREFLADASAVQFTRSPEGISGALNKILNNKYGSSIKVADTEEVEHMLFSASKLSFLFATHPPLDLRIERLGVHKAMFSEEHGGYSESASSALAGVPSQVKEQISAPYSARLFIFALLLSEMSYENQQQEIVKFPETDQSLIRNCLLGLNPEDSFIEVELAIPVLQELSEKKRLEFLNQVASLISADQKVTVRELSVYVILKHSLLTVPNIRYRFDSINYVRVLSALAGIDKSAFIAGAKEIGLSSATEPSFDVQDFVSALQKLYHAPLAEKMKLIAACKVVVNFDGKISKAEAELLRALSLAIGCPVKLDGV